MLAFWIGPWEFILLVLVIVLLFGSKRIVQAGRAIGRGARGFKDEITTEPEKRKELPKARDEL